MLHVSARFPDRNKDQIRRWHLSKAAEIGIDFRVSDSLYQVVLRSNVSLLEISQSPEFIFGIGRQLKFFLGGTVFF